jgi:hypothetical protein
MEKKINFVYITNKKQYIGDQFIDDLKYWKTKNYLGSGLLKISKRINNLIK